MEAATTSAIPPVEIPGLDLEAVREAFEASVFGSVTVEPLDGPIPDEFWRWASDNADRDDDRELIARARSIMESDGVVPACCRVKTSKGEVTVLRGMGTPALDLRELHEQVAALAPDLRRDAPFVGCDAIGLAMLEILFSLRDEAPSA